MKKPHSHRMRSQHSGAGSRESSESPSLKQHASSPTVDRQALVLVILQAPEQMTAPEMFSLDALLFEYKGRLRTAVAEAINRKKAPELTLRVVKGPSV